MKDAVSAQKALQGSESGPGSFWKELKRIVFTNEGFFHKKRTEKIELVATLGGLQ